ncbi:MAG: F0F1 ATP synthase subunit delta [Candidatus Paceibacterota bacterium]|jgi:F-type H+-transporting ATPase subunit delta
MATISINNLARAIYESSSGKEGADLDLIVKNTVKLLSEKHMIGKSKELLDRLEKLVDKGDDLVRAKISSKTKLEKKTIEEIEEFIKKRYKIKNSVLVFETDEKLIGGIKIEVGDEIIDMTLQNKIHKLKNYLITN